MGQDKIVLEVEKRAELGKAARRLRRDGIMPANVYERGQPSIAVKAQATVLSKVYAQAGKHTAIELNIGKVKKLAMIKDVDYDPVKGEVRHIAFHAVKQDESVTAEVPIRLTEDIPAERASFMVLTPTTMVEVEALPGDLPSEFLVDANSLNEIGDKLKVSDIKLPTGVTIISDPELIIGIVEETKDQVAIADAEAEANALAEASDVESEHGAEESPEENGEETGEDKTGGKESTSNENESKNDSNSDSKNENKH